MTNVEIKSLIKIYADLSQVVKVSEWINSNLGDQLSTARITTIDLAVAEVCNNIIDHGYKNPPAESATIEAELEMCEAVHIKICDYAKQFVLTPPQDLPETPEIRGYGLHIVRSITSHFDVINRPDGNTWILDFSREV